MNNALMIDLETLCTGHTCVILTIGAVSFNPIGRGIIERLELKPTIEDQINLYNRTISEETVAWWSKQNPQAIEEAFSDNNRESFKECMQKLYKFSWNRSTVWSNGASFDIVACETGFKQTLTNEYPNPVPWPFYTIRDTRTLWDIAGVSIRDKKYGTKTTHKAIEDAEHQVIVVQDAYTKLIKLGLTSHK